MIKDGQVNKPGRNQPVGGAKSHAEATAAADYKKKCWQQDITGASLGTCLNVRTSDGAYYVTMALSDKLVRRQVRPGVVEWRHDNGYSYYDPVNGLTACNTAVFFQGGAHNWTKYQWVRPGMWLQGNAATREPPFYI